MRFARDILLLDIEATGINLEKDLPLQIAAVLLDKDNLLEKDWFNSYVRHSFSQSTNDQVVQTLGITKEVLFKSPGLKDVLSAFNSKFPYNVILASQNILNIDLLRQAYKRTGISYEYDYHIIELWTLGYLFLSRQNIKKIPTATTLGQYFKLERKKDHDALVNCRYLAEIFRKLIQNYAS